MKVNTEKHFSLHLFFFYQKTDYHQYIGEACLQQDTTLSVNTFLSISSRLYFTCCKQNQFLFLSSLILVNMINIPHLSTLRYIKALRITKKSI